MAKKEVKTDLWVASLLNDSKIHYDGNNSITSSNIDAWLKSVDVSRQRLETYYTALTSQVK